jgi:hypothetical protein
MHSMRLIGCGFLVLAVACGDDSSEGGGTTSPATSLDTTNVGATPGTSGVTSTGPDEPTGGATGGDTTTTGGTTTTSETTAGPGTSSTSSPVTVTDGDESTAGPPDTSTGPNMSTGPDSSSSGGPVCPEDQIVCMGDTAQVCDGLGGFKSEEVCPGACVPDKGCTACFPGEVSCQGNDVVVCNPEGSGTDVDQTCDALQGLMCDPNAEGCAGACAGLGLSYIGCDYYPTVLQQHDGYNTAPTTEFAVAVANTTGQAAQVTVTRAGNMVSQVMVAPGAVQVIKLPWVNELTKGSGPSVLVADGAYRLRSSQPVTVYQYNPLNATTTNDSSVLLPVNTWTGDYLVAAWPHWIGSYPGFYAVVARQDNTTVTVTPSATGKAVQQGGGIAANGTGQVVLNEGDVLQVMSQSGDVTGTLIHADKQIQVFGGHECTNVPLDIAACDHLEESMFPIETLAKEYVVVPPVQVPNDQLDKAQVVRVIASEANTTLTFTPDQPVAKVLANAGDFVELKTTTAKFIVTSDKRILVSQYMVGQSGGFGTSDPAMLLAVNPLQWRKNYLFYAATTWQANYVDVLGPKNAVVKVDGNPVAAWQPIGASNYQVAHIKLSNAGDGSHTVTSDLAVGIGAYGVQDYGSYWYPGGLDLDVLPQ